MLALLHRGIDVHCMRDLTRGGLASALVEIAEASGTTLRFEESAVPVLEPVRGACELLGLDPFYVANEGRMIAIVPGDQADSALEAMQSDRAGESAGIIGYVHEKELGKVIVRSTIGTDRVVDMISGEQLPRIC